MTDPRKPSPRDLVPTSVLPAAVCKAHTSSGRPCKKSAIVGGFVCATHGGSAPQVRRKANERMMALAPRAVQVLGELLNGAESEVVRLRAATELLDRGVGKAVDVSLDITPEDHSGPSPLDLAIARAMAARGVDVPEVIDAEVVDDDGEDPPSPSPGGALLPPSPLSL